MSDAITDGAGRTIKLRRVGVLETLRLYKALGPALAANEAYMGLAVVAASAAMIDELPLPFPASEAAVEALLERLGDDGAAAVATAIAPAPAETVIADAGN